jgi:type I restriction enzyme, S subunit
VSYSTYPTYRQARHLWLDQIPTQWDSVNIRLVAKRSSGGTPDKTNSLFWIEGTIPWLNSGEVNQGVITEPTTYITEDALSQSSAKWIPENAIIIALAGQGKTKGMAAITTFRTTCNQSMAAIVFEVDHPKYMYWWLVSQYRNIRGMASDDARDGLNLEMIATIPCPRPSLLEQQKIAAFLDWKTSQIDALIAKKQDLLEKLKEKRLAVITQAVTKGLNPAAPVRNSGIFLLDDLPTDWQIKRLRHCAGLITSGSRGWAQHFADSGSLFLRITNLTRESIELDLNDIQRVAPPDGAEGDRTYTQAGDILISITADLGSVAVIPKKLEAAYVSQHLSLVRLDSEDIDPLWIAYSVLSHIGKYQLLGAGYGGTKVQLSLGDIKEIVFCHPPTREKQLHILRFIEAATRRSDNLISLAESVIARLTEYRAAVISAATNGKIDVREVKIGAMA